MIFFRDMQCGFNQLMYAILLFFVILKLTTDIDTVTLIIVAIIPVMTWGEILKHHVREEIMNE